MKSGTVSIASLRHAARILGREEIPAQMFVDELFTDREDVGYCSKCRYGRDHTPVDGAIEYHEVEAYAKEWDDWGLTDPLTFVNSLAVDTIGTPEHVNTIEIMNALAWHPPLEDGVAGNSNLDTVYGADDGFPVLEPGLCTNDALDKAGW